MSSSREFLAYVLDLLSDTADVSYRKMMGEYVLYSEGKVFGGIYDDRFLIKVTESSSAMLPDAPLETPYSGAKQMLLVDGEDRAFLAEVVAAMLPEIAVTKKKPAASAKKNSSARKKVAES